MGGRPGPCHSQPAGLMASCRSQLRSGQFSRMWLSLRASSLESLPWGDAGWGPPGSAAYWEVGCWAPSLSSCPRHLCAPWGGRWGHMPTWNTWPPGWGPEHLLAPAPRLILETPAQPPPKPSQTLPKFRVATATAQLHQSPALPNAPAYSPSQQPCWGRSDSSQSTSVPLSSCGSRAHGSVQGLPGPSTGWH